VDYNGTAKVTPIYSKVNSTSYTFIYRCQNCFIFDDPSQPSFNTSTSQGTFQQGWAQSTVFPADRTNPDSSIVQHDNGMGEFQIVVSKAANSGYAQWASSATASATPTSSSAAATSTYKGVPVPTATSYDYVVVGGGAAGIPIADKLSAAGHSVLLIEKGVASSARWGGSESCSSLNQSNTKIIYSITT
jgi:cellobiose dehydrogenase (acceptor)